MEYAPRLPFGASLTSWGISTIMIIGSLAISANKRNTSKDKRTVPLSSKMLIVVASIEFEDYNLARMFKDNLTVDNQDNFEVKIDPTGTATFTWGASQ